VAFQTERAESQTANLAVFDHVQVKHVYAQLNKVRYPMFDMDLDFTQMKISGATKRFVTSRRTTMPFIIPSMMNDDDRMLTLDSDGNGFSVKF